MTTYTVYLGTPFYTGCHGAKIYRATQVLTFKGYLSHFSPNDVEPTTPTMDMVIVPEMGDKLREQLDRGSYDLQLQGQGTVGVPHPDWRGRWGYGTSLWRQR